MKIGLISDTHGFLDPNVFNYFEDCDEIWHAGDIGSLEVLDHLESFKPTRSVFGNIDDRIIQERTIEDLIFDCEGLSIFITHIAAKPPRYNPRVRKLIDINRPDLLVCGHSHFLKVEKDENNSLLFLNPGAAGKQGFHKMRTLLRLTIQDSKVQNLEVIELGLRGTIT